VEKQPPPARRLGWPAGHGLDDGHKVVLLGDDDQIRGTIEVLLRAIA
jgi:hypothetical protein